MKLLSTMLLLGAQAALVYGQTPTNCPFGWSVSDIGGQGHFCYKCVRRAALSAFPCPRSAPSNVACDCPRRAGCRPTSHLRMPELRLFARSMSCRTSRRPPSLATGWCKLSSLGRPLNPTVSPREGTLPPSGMSRNEISFTLSARACASAPAGAGTSSRAPCAASLPRCAPAMHRASPSNQCWTGGNDRSTEGTWRWSDGSSRSYINSFWSSGQPDNMGVCLCCDVLVLWFSTQHRDAPAPLGTEPRLPSHVGCRGSRGLRGRPRLWLRSRLHLQDAWCVPG